MTAEGFAFLETQRAAESLIIVFCLKVQVRQKPDRCDFGWIVYNSCFAESLA